ncbi:hypothetical protein FAES_3990 [Fibrella aestuarina BUZ 2]|uniref:Uncharacterized protein n=1 Tax=Fibrella aestuarina BUZ 2 TaxID=1166018 RepID=I0KCY8_9BACT|nr:phage tail tube protein [Fibrella aestuarina]CCH01991.1 hypothetical protein FAES_3990 [Fibrella aestuarina BUZ 2]
MSAINASDVRVSVYTGTPTPVKKVVARQTDLSFNRGKAEIEVSSKQSGQWAEFLSGRKNAEVTFDAFVETNPVVGEVSEAVMDDIYDSPNAYKWAIESALSGTRSREFFAVMTKFDLKLQQENGAMYSITLRVTGQPTTTVVA